MVCVACNSDNNKKVLTINGFNVHKCKSCGLIFTYPLPEDKLIEDYYQGFLFEKPKPNQINKALKRKRKEFKKAFNLTQNCNKTFLDYGGGTGIAWKAAEQEKLNAYYFDLDKHAQNFAIENLGLTDKQVFNPINHPEISFDYIWSDNVIEHLKNPEAYLLRLYSLLNPGGTLIIKTPRASNYETFFIFSIWFYVYFLKALRENSFLKTFKAVFVDKYWHCEPPRHLFAFSNNSIEKIVKKIGIPKDKVSIKSYLLNPYKFSLLYTILNIRKKAIIPFVILFCSAFILLELLVIGLRFSLIGLKVLSQSGMLIKIVKD